MRTWLGSCGRERRKARDPTRGVARRDGLSALDAPLEPSPPPLRAVRYHWGIENRDPHVRDRILGEDDSRIRRRPGGLARLRSLALNILRGNGIGNVRQGLYRKTLSLDRLLAYAVA